MSSFHIVVSAENSAYMAWQCKLFHYSCVSRVGVTPIFFVHDSGEEWHPAFEDIVRAGGMLRGAPSYIRTASGGIYKARNTPGTLLEASEYFGRQAGRFVLCDPDMLFLRKPNFSSSLSGDFYGYMNYEQKEVLAATRRFGLSTNEILNRPELRCGVPHVVPIEAARSLAETWLEAIDQFALNMWEISMYALGLAVVRLRMPLNLTYLLGQELRLTEHANADMIHYCVVNDGWDKRAFFSEEAAARVWEATVQACPGTILAEILAQIREARYFYSRLGV